ncbi:hypothetical protein [Nocardiopsis sp. Huas11]|uniref:hypothetical protein n=1 Tax=Nocardiopsis sp. Huas11 TaxID=2183912 RepID=UPI000EB01BF7|nr:hypothetical protein [Nocardiopsis sp. Huas11]
MIDAIVTTGWEAIPGPADYYRPAAAREDLLGLAHACGRTDAASAASLPAEGGIVHDHSGTVLPAAVQAAPILLGIADQGCDAARAAALELLEDALCFRPWRGSARTQRAVRLCCAIAAHIHTRGPALAGLGARSRSLLATAREHWRVDIEETCVEGPTPWCSAPCPDPFRSSLKRWSSMRMAR